MRKIFLILLVGSIVLVSLPVKGWALAPVGPPIPSNLPPIANAGPDQTVKPGTLVTLDGNGSKDLDVGDSITAYTWEITEWPGGSKPTLNGLNTATPSFTTTTDLIGDYIIKLFVTDSHGLTSSDEVKVCTTNPPVADAGSDQPVKYVKLVTLDGSQSSDPDGDLPLTFKWKILSVPIGSTVGSNINPLNNSDTATPSFTPDFRGDYIFKLVVTDSHGMPSEPDDSGLDTVIVSTENSAPVADAGDDIKLIQIESTVQLDGMDSYDIDEEDQDNLDYLWEIVTKPEGSIATLDDPTSKTPTFRADVHGNYVIGLIVSDKLGPSPQDLVNISFTNVRPVANAGKDQSVKVGETVNLDGSGSYDKNNDELTYEWGLVSKPSGSTVAGLSQSDPTSSEAYFVPDKPGAYIVSLTVDDGFARSKRPDNVRIVAVSLENAVICLLREAIAKINRLDHREFKFKWMRKDLTGNINYVIKMADKEHYRIALATLQYGVLPKMDGCAEDGMPDKGSPLWEYDWLITCEAQGQVYPLIFQAIELLRGLL